MREKSNLQSGGGGGGGERSQRFSQLRISINADTHSDLSAFALIGHSAPHRGALRSAGL